MIKRNAKEIQHAIVRDRLVHPCVYHKWRWGALICNPSITWDIIQQHPDKPWSWASLSFHSSLTWNIVQQHLNKPWNWSGLSENANILCSDKDVSDCLFQDRRVANMHFDMPTPIRIIFYVNGV